MFLGRLWARFLRPVDIANFVRCEEDMKITMLLFLCVFLFPCGVFAGDSGSVLENDMVSASERPQRHRKFVVLPFRTTKNRYHFLAGDKSFMEVSQLFRQKCIAALAETGRFEIPGADGFDEMLRVRNFELSADTPLATQMEIAETLDIDYLLVGTILEAREEQIPYSIHVSGEKGQHYKGSFVVDYRIMVVAGQEVKWSDSVIVNADDSSLRKKAVDVSSSEWHHFLLLEAARQIASKVIADIYPLRVVRVLENGEVIVNHGETLLVPGERFDVFTRGEDIFDPETGEALGATEIWAATIKITRVTEKTSYATILDGDLSDRNIGGQCRQVQKKKSHRKNPGRVSDVQPTYDGGVVLPFD